MPLFSILREILDGTGCRLILCRAKHEARVLVKQRLSLFRTETASDGTRHCLQHKGIFRVIHLEAVTLVVPYMSLHKKIIFRKSEQVQKYPQPIITPLECRSKDSPPDTGVL